MEKHRKRSSKKKHNRGGELSAKAMIYSGPVRVPRQLRTQSTFTVICTSDELLTSSGAGVLNEVYQSTPSGPGGSMGAAANWAGLIAIFNEFRTLAFEIEYQPADRYNRGNIVNTSSIDIVVDYASSTPIPNRGTADDYEGLQLKSLDVPFKFKAGMSDNRNSLFASTTASLPVFWIKTFASGLNFSTTYGTLIWRARVQMRGLGT